MDVWTQYADRGPTCSIPLAIRASLLSYSGCHPLRFTHLRLRVKRRISGVRELWRQGQASVDVVDPYGLGLLYVGSCFPSLSRR